MAHSNPHPDARVRRLADEIATLAAHIDAAMYRWLELLREFDECGGWAGDGMKSLAHWLNWQCGISLGTARERVRVAHALKDLPQTSAEFRSGRLSYSKVRAITREATAANESVFLDIAHHGTAWHVERVVRSWRREHRAEALQAENRRHDLRELNFHTDGDGCLVMKARLTPEQGAVVRQAIEAMTDSLFRERENVPAGTPDGRPCDARIPAGPEPQSTPAGAARADALARIAEAWLADGDSAGSADRFTINLHTDAETLRADGRGAESELEDGGNVPAETCRRFACDASVIEWLEDSRGQALSVGRKTRSVPPAIRRALHRRDRGCRFPGCTCTRFVDAHHIHHWADGGATHIDNLVLLCRRHHRLLHEGGFELRRTAGGAFLFADPEGRSLPSAPTTRSRGNVFRLIARNSAEGLPISPANGRTLWDGGPMDESILMHHLQRRSNSDQSGV